MYRSDGTPVLLNTPIGKVVEKSVESYTVICPDCELAARYTETAEPVCPSCGLICDGVHGKQIPKSNYIVIDAKAAGRLPAENPTS